MYDLKWFKFDLWTFDRAEFKYIESCEGGPMFLYYWVRLLSEAAKLNDGGRVYVFKNSKIDFSELAILLRSDEETMTRAIFLYDSLGLITYNAEAGIVIKNWSSYIGDNARADSDGARESEYADGTRELEYTDGEEEPLCYGAERAPEKSREKIVRERNREGNEGVTKARQESDNVPATLSARRVKIKDMTPEERREYDRLAKRRKRAREQEIDGCDGEQNNTADVGKYDVQNVQNSNVQNLSENVQNVQNANNYVQNPVQMSKNRVQNVQNECPKKLDKISDNVQNSPKNIFIEENREEENRRNKNRGEENREKTINNNSLSPSQRGEEKNKYGTLGNVFLSNTELEELNGRLGVGKVSRLIDDLSEHMASTGKTYLSHYATLLRWSKNEYAPRDSELSFGWSEARSAEAPSERELSPQVTEGECDSQSAPLGNGYEVRTARGLFPPLKTVPLSPGERQVGECDSQSGSLGNGYARRYDAWDSFNSRSGDYANKKGPRDKPREPKSRYGDFDPEEAMRLAIERTMRECGTVV